MAGVEENMPAIEAAIEVLNRIHQADSTVMPALIALRVPCNETVADDPSVQVQMVRDGETAGRFEVGVLGIINGIFGVDAAQVGFIGAFYDDAGVLVRFDWTKANAGGRRPKR